MLGTKVIEERNSEYNGNLRVISTWGMGTYIQADGLTQSGGIVNTIWQSTLRKLKKESINNCLILGLGGGTVVKLILKYWPKARITGVDIDQVIINLGKKYLDLKKVKIIIKDAYIFKNEINYDLLIVDLYKGDKFPKKFETLKFLKTLTKNKIVIFNRLYYKDKKEEANKFEVKLHKVFSKVDKYFPPVNIMFICS
ncbi:MAG: hypothetical protein UT00_C0015G0003 [Parcubacteria group bacterium GW2011_GWA1_38_7]|nr:MAG: hypothetical protein UT00_C0015G0003 [Parcubacteria group bacterium GW2011_GWA1_38_7]